MAVTKGVDLVVSIGGNTLGGQRGATLNRSAEAIDVTNKSSADAWKENVAGFKEWSIDCDGLYILNDTAYLALATAFANGTSVSVKLAYASNVQYTGSAFITDFPIEAPYDDAATYSVSFTGTSTLTVA